MVKFSPNPENVKKEKNTTKLQITLPNDGVQLLEKVREKYRINKSSAIYTLILKYLEKEYGDLN